MLNRLRSFDVFGQKFGFNAYKDSGTFTTVVGGLITLLWIGLISVVSFLIISNYIDTTKPVISVNRIRLPKPMRINFEESQVALALITFDGKQFLTAHESRRYVTFAGKFIKTYKRGNETAEESTFRASFPCAETPEIDKMNQILALVDQVESKIDLGKMFLKSTICVVLEEPHEYVEGDKSNLPFIRNTIDIFPCSLPDPTQCASLEELCTLQILFAKGGMIPKYKQKKDPLVPTIDFDDAFYIDIASKTVMTMFQKFNYIYDDDVGILDERLTYKFVDSDNLKVMTGSRVTRSTHCTEKQIEEGRCEPYIEAVQRTSKEKFVIQRRYKTIFGVISEIGGFNDLIILVLWVSYFIYNSYSYKRLITAHLMAEFSQNCSKIQKSPNSPINYNNNPKNSKKGADILNQDPKEANPLPELNLLTRTYSQSKIILEMIFLRCKALEILLPQLVLKKKRNQITKAKQTQISFDQNDSQKRNSKNVPEPSPFAKITSQPKQINSEWKDSSSQGHLDLDAQESPKNGQKFQKPKLFRKVEASNPITGQSKFRSISNSRISRRRLKFGSRPNVSKSRKKFNKFSEKRNLVD